ncbi:MAG: hypothetical protein K0Q91_1477 [Fibrobacteria bacterium]|nr:hypothetical protein [Fibrobacteria bacterium]
MTLSRLLLFPVCLSALLLAGCPTDGRRDSFNHLRSPVSFSIDPATEDHPFCQTSVGPGLTFATLEECRSTRKYRLRWDRPEDTVGFTEYRIYVDTTPPNRDGLAWSEVRKDPALATFRMEGRPPASDSILFILTSSGGSEQIFNRNAARIVKLDTTGRLDSLGKLMFAIATIYADARLNGEPRYTWVITTDRFSPYPLQPAYKPKARSVEVSWSRPGDPTSFFDPEADSGLIRGYVLRVVRGGAVKALVPFRPVLALYSAGGVNRTGEARADSFRTTRGAPGVRFWLPDSQRAFSQVLEDARDSLRVTLGNIAPQDTVDISLWAVDLEGNATDSGVPTRILLTDTTQPTTPVLGIVEGSVTRNSLAYTFTASRDRVETGGVLAPAASPNANILEYRLSRRRGGTAGGAPAVDSVFKIPASQRGFESFTDTVRYLPPGAQYRLTVQAIDSSGHASEIGSLDTSTLPASFTGPDAGATCPPGFMPIPAGRFVLGSNLGGDESPGTPGIRGIGAYCIETFEHRAGWTSGAFQTKVTWEQARDVCAAAGHRLCTEAEWERACEGTEAAPLTYGIQSEARNPQNVRYACNIGTNDSAMAGDINLRDPTCLSYDGVFDMAGNYAEWVMDPHTPGGYPSGDTAIVGQPHTTPTASSERVFRGTHYLNTGLTPAVMQSAGRCSNRDVPKQLRPKPYAGCTDPDRPKLVVTYVGKPPRCFTLPDSLYDRNVLSVRPTVDTNQIRVLMENPRPDGQNTTELFPLPLDTAYRQLKPLDALMTPRALAVVTFVNSQTSEAIVDTLDATEILPASEAGRGLIFAREVSPPWSVQKDGSGKFAIRFLYAYAISEKVRARTYYSNKIIGFRCCSDPIPAPLGKRRR